MNIPKWEPQFSELSEKEKIHKLLGFIDANKSIALSTIKKEANFSWADKSYTKYLENSGYIKTFDITSSDQIIDILTAGKLYYEKENERLINESIKEAVDNWSPGSVTRFQNHTVNQIERIIERPVKSNWFVNHLGIVISSVVSGLILVAILYFTYIHFGIKLY